MKKYPSFLDYALSKNPNSVVLSLEEFISPNEQSVVVDVTTLSIGHTSKEVFSNQGYSEYEVYESSPGHFSMFIFLERDLGEEIKDSFPGGWDKFRRAVRSNGGEFSSIVEIGGEEWLPLEISFKKEEFEYVTDELPYLWNSKFATSIKNILELIKEKK